MWHTCWLDSSGHLYDWCNTGVPYLGDIEEDRANIRDPEEGFIWYIDTDAFIAAGTVVGEIWMAWREP